MARSQKKAECRIEYISCGAACAPATSDGRPVKTALDRIIDCLEHIR